MSKNREINFITIIITLIKYKTIAFSKWRQIIGVAVCAGLLGIVYAWLGKKEYVAELTLALEDKSSAGMYSSIASQFGVDLGKGDGGVFKGDNIIELFKSKSMLENALLTSYNFDGNEQLLIERYLLANNMETDIQLTNFNKPKNTFSRAEDSLIQVITDAIIKNKLEWGKVEKNLSIVRFSFKSKDELFAKVFLENLTHEVSEFYVATKTKKQKLNLQALSNRIDSVKMELDKEMNAAANNQDQNLNASVAKVRVPFLKRQMNIQLLTTLYGELTKNSELSKMSLAKEEPLLQIIDKPTLPLKFEKKSRLFSGILFSLVGGFLTMMYFIGMDIYKQITLEVEAELKSYDRKIG